MLRKYTVKSLRVLRLASQLMLCMSTWPQVPPGECRIAIRAADDFTFIRVKFRLLHKFTCINAVNCTNKFFDP